MKSTPNVKQACVHDNYMLDLMEVFPVNLIPGCSVQEIAGRSKKLSGPMSPCKNCGRKVVDCFSLFYVNILIS